MLYFDLGKKLRYEKSCVCKLFFEIWSWFLCFSKFRENDGSSKTCYKCSKAIARILHVSNLNSYHKYYKSRESFILQLLFWFTISTSFSWEVEIYVPFPIYINPTQSCAWTLLVTFQSLEFDYERFSCELLMNALFWKSCYKCGR